MSARAFVLFGSLLVTAVPSLAQTPGTFEIGGFGAYTFFDDTLSLEDNVGGGGTLGIFLVRNLAIEAEGAFISTNTETGTTSMWTIPRSAGGSPTTSRSGAMPARFESAPAT